MWQSLLVGAIVLLLEPVAHWGPWWRGGLIVLFLFAALGKAIDEGADARMEVHKGG